MNAMRGFAMIIGSGVLFSIVGGGLGYALARVAPSYYRGVFRAGESPWFNPVEVGLGLGISQGLIAGLAVGSIVVLATAMSKLRRPAKEPLDLV